MYVSVTREYENPVGLPADPIPFYLTGTIRNEMMASSRRHAYRIFVTALLLGMLLLSTVISIASASEEEQCAISDAGEKVCGEAAAASKSVPCVDKHEVGMVERSLADQIE